MASDALELFSVSFLKTLLNVNQEKNIFYSPVSIMAAFSMLCLGTRNESAKQLCQALRLEKCSADIHNEISELIGKCSITPSEYDETRLAIANGLFLQHGFKIKDDYKSGLQKFYKSEIKQMDFESHSAAKEINHWIESKTNNKIKDMFQDNAFNSFTKLVLANAVYFKGNFKDGFKKESTHEKDFFKNANTKVKVQMMQIGGDYHFAEDSKMGIKVLSVPFHNFKLKLLLFLPTERFGLDKVINNFKDNDLRHLVSSLNLRIVSKLEVPKFKIDSAMNLTDLMKLLGVTDIFTRGKADLKGISDEELFVDKAVHKTFLDVNENGVEAAAATAMSICCMSMPFYADETPIEFIVDEPFLISIYNNETQTTVFLGRINNPI